MSDTVKKAKAVLQEILADSRLGHFVDKSIHIPNVYKGTGKIHLIFLGQDPTIKNPSNRAKIKTVLNLDRRNSLRNYLNEMCEELGLSLEENIYATNFFKNFFIEPPTQIKEINIFKKFPRYWLPLLIDELNVYPNIPIVTLGEPLLSVLVHNGIERRVRHYWGYTSRWKLGETGIFDFIKPSKNYLNRVLFPFPHQPSKNKEFYKDRFKSYISFVKQHM